MAIIITLLAGLAAGWWLRGLHVSSAHGRAYGQASAEAIEAVHRMSAAAWVAEQQICRLADAPQADRQAR
jgi:hypothetical protein